MYFVRIKPSLKTLRFAESFWWMEFDCDKEQDIFFERVLPDGCSEIIFHFGDKVNRVFGGSRLSPEPRCFFIGQNTEHYNIAAQGRVKMFGVRFNPHTASFLLREHASQFNDSFVDLPCLLGNAVNSLYENLYGRICETGDLQSAVRLIESFFAKFWTDENSPQLVYLDFAVKRITLDKGCTELSELARKIGVTNRYLEKLFDERVGISPKTFAQIVRLQESVRLMSAGKDLSLTEISAAAGYFDQSHFIRFVKRFAGVTPSELQREKLMMQTPFFNSI